VQCRSTTFVSRRENTATLGESLCVKPAMRPTGSRDSGASHRRRPGNRVAGMATTVPTPIGRRALGCSSHGDGSSKPRRLLPSALGGVALRQINASRESIYFGAIVCPGEASTHADATSALASTGHTAVLTFAAVCQRTKSLRDSGEVRLALSTAPRKRLWVGGEALCPEHREVVGLITNTTLLIIRTQDDP
jgi:hypothetical protein